MRYFIVSYSVNTENGLMLGSCSVSGNSFLNYENFNLQMKSTIPNTIGTFSITFLLEINEQDFKEYNKPL